jgi:hypothetical protein
MSAIPSEYPVTMSDGVREYQVFDASAYHDAVFAHGHRRVEETAEQIEPDAE